MTAAVASRRQVSTNEFRDSLRTILQAVESGKSTYEITRYGRPIAVLQKVEPNGSDEKARPKPRKKGS